MKLVYLISLVVLVVLVSGCVQPKPGPDYPEQEVPSDLYASYSYTAEATYVDIQIEKNKLSYTYFEDIEDKCAQWFLQAPCWESEDLKTVEAQLSTKELSELYNLVQTVDFFNLEDTYGGASEGQRYYSYTLNVKANGKEKEVVYQSFPEASPEPEQFVKVRDKLLTLVDEKFTS